MILIMINEEIKWGEERREILLMLYALFSIPNIEVFSFLFS